MATSVSRSVEILEMLSLGQNRITDICQELGLSKSTAHRLLKNLEQCGLVFQDPISHQYFLDQLIIKFSLNPTITHQNLIYCAYDELKMLRDYSNETTALYIPIGNRRICLEAIDSKQSIKLVVEKGSVSPIYTGSISKVLLSQFPDDMVEQLLDHTPLIKIARNTVTDRKVLLQELEKIREQGYSISSSETLDGASAISVPIKGYSCPVAIGIVGPQFHLELKSKKLIKIMKESAKRISESIKKHGSKLIRSARAASRKSTS
jgi:IclR family transcriptional regulator, KDG regulon repressor